MSARLLKSLVYAKSFISVLPINSVDALLDYADDEDEQEQHYGQRRRVSHLFVYERILIDITCEYQTGILRPVLEEEDAELSEHLEVGYECHQYNEGRRPSQKRQRDVEELVPPARMVEFSCFVDLSRYAIDAG